MNYLFNSIIVDGGEIVKYRVYEFKLYPGKYKVQLSTIYGGSHLKEVVFWKSGTKWVTEPPTVDAEYIAKTVAADIERHKQ